MIFSGRRTSLPRLGVVLAAALAAGCTSSAAHVEQSGSRVLSAYEEKAAAPAPEKPAEPGVRAPLKALAADPAAAPTDAAARGNLPDGFLAPLGKQEGRVPLALEDCLRRALVNNLTIQIARYNPAIAETGIVQAEAIFDPSYFMNNAAGRSREETGSFIFGASTLAQRQWSFATGARSLLPTGATIGLEQDWTYLATNSVFISPDPQWAASMPLTVRQPLLKGAGFEVNKAPIVLARLERNVSLADFETRLMDTLLEVEQTYWQLVLGQATVDAVNDALTAARENLRVVQRRFEEGRDRRVIVSLAESAVTSREADLIAARLALARTSDALKRLMNDPELPLKEPVVLRATELPIAEPVPVTMATLQQSMLAAIKFRPELQQADERLAQFGVRENVARHERLPRMDLVGQYGLTGLNRTGSQLDWALHRQFGTEFYEWQAGVEFEVPLGNRAAIATYQRAKLEREQALKVREDTEQRILLDVSTAVRNLAAAEEEVLATRAARRAAEQTLKDMEANVGAGAALQKDLLDAQRDLADAIVREMQAMTGYMTSLASLERAKGSLLDYNNIHLLDEGKPKGPASKPDKP
jgi:outer membrane protein TolC